MRIAASEHPASVDSSAQVLDERPRCGGGLVLRRLIIVVLLLVIAFVLRSRWLPMVAYPLLAPAPQHLNKVTLVWVHSHDGRGFAGDGVIARTAALLEAHPQARVIFTAGWSSRLVEIGAIPPPIALLRKALAQHGIAPDRIMELEVQGYDFWNEARAMDGYLSEHPREQVILLTEEFGGRSHAIVLHAALRADNSRRVEILGLPDFRYSYHDWWKSRAGVKGVMVGYLYLIHTVVQPQPPGPPRRLSLDDFERLIPESPGGGP